MASANKTVTVLAPNGRRQNVKVTPNSTILQILEEVCKKQGLKPEEYDLKHHKNVLDVSSMIRFSGLPNNAQLEMCPITKIRAENPVILGLQLENGDRLMGNYFPGENLWNILVQLCPNEVKIENNPVVIYMRQEIYGMDTLKNTTLKSLGLTGGRAMLRLIHRQPEQLHTQANVSTPLPSKPVEEKPYIRKLQKLDPEISEIVPESELMPNSDDVKTNSSSSEIKAKRDIRSRTPSPTKEKEIKKSNNYITDFVKKEKGKKTSDPQKIKSSKNTTEEIKKNEPELDDFVFLGERNALAFSLDTYETMPTELPDEFFDLTIKDAKKLLRDLKQRRIELEETPLQTAVHRNLEQDKKILRHLNQYKKSVIRIQFPDRTVLQGTFKPLETIKIVKDFVCEYLEDSKCKFHLFTTPPKSVLKSETTLLDAECVPSALVHFGVDFPVKDDQRFLKESLYNQFISPSVASLAAVKTRRADINLEKKEDPEEINITEFTNFSIPTTPMDVDDVNVGAGTSNAPEPNTMHHVPERQEKIPKWFNPKK